MQLRAKLQHFFNLLFTNATIFIFFFPVELNIETPNVILMDWF